MRSACRPADNPFASHRVEALGFRGAEVVMRRGSRAAIVGPKGSGKTTLLEELGRRLDGLVVTVRIPGSCPNPWATAYAQLPQPVTSRHAILVDGSEQLGAIAWRRLIYAIRHASCLIVTLHRPGRLPTLVECRTDPSLLRDLVGELAPADATRLEPGLEDLFQRHRGNLRSCFRELYDEYAGRGSLEF